MADRLYELRVFHRALADRSRRFIDGRTPAALRTADAFMLKGIHARLSPDQAHALAPFFHLAWRALYARAQHALALVRTGKLHLYGNILPLERAVNRYESRGSNAKGWPPP